VNGAGAVVLGAAERAVLLALADDEHLMGQRHTEWIGVAPFLEEDMAFASIGQDELGHAAMLYERVLADDGEATDREVDALAFRREPAEYRSCWLAEAACTEWAHALVRHWLYDAAEVLRWAELAGSVDERLRGIAGRALREEQYHRRHADALLDALAGDPDADRRIAGALEDLLPLAVGVFDTPVGADGADPRVVGRPLPELQPEWRIAVARRFGPLDWASVAAVEQEARTVRSDDFVEVYGDMREVIMIDPTATW
jgi:ring-1,2-phenylacetyl-CoA epoxidase subunit PaaC